MQHYISELIDLLLVLVAAWMVPAVIFVIYAYFARLKYPVSESVFGRVVIISFFIITTSIWLPIIVGALALSLIGHLWSRFRTKPRVDSANRHRSCSAPQVVLIGEGDNVPQALLDAANTSSRSRRGRENNRIAMHESGSGFSDTVGLTDDVGCRG